MLARTLQSAFLAASILAGSLVVLTLYLNPSILLRDEIKALFVAIFLPYVLAGTGLLLVLALAANLVRWPLAPRPPLPSVPWFTSLALITTVGSAALYWLNLWEYRHSIPLDLLRGLTASAVAVSAVALVLLAVAFDLVFFPARSRAPAAALLIVGPALAVAFPLALRPTPAPDPRPAPVAAEPLRPQRRIVLFGVDGLSPVLLQEALARGAQPVFTRLLERGAHGPLATLRPTEAPPLWNTILTGRLPRDHGVKSFATYHLWGSRASYELLPSFAFVSFLERTRLVTTSPISSANRQRRALWNCLDAFSIPSGFVRTWGTFPAERVQGFLLSPYFHLLLDDKARAALTLFPQELLPEAAARAVRPKDVDKALLLEFVDASAENDSFPWRRELVERALAPDLTYQRAGSLLRSVYDPPFFATYVYGLDVVGHAFLRFAQPERFGDVPPEEARRYGRVLDRYLSLVGQWIFEAQRGLGPDDVMVVVSAYGLEPVPLWRRLLSGRERSGTHANAPDGLILAVGAGIRPGARLTRASVLDVTPTLLYLAGLPVGRDMEGRVLAEMIDESFAREHPVSYIPSYESLAVTKGPQAQPVDDLPPLPDEVH
ncbi:MAG TPA: alkaline phosphatase family protein [Vicinamibacteria bacterium]|nr:alkaline phosphatase family protein [Vicinamibacteria bacterium]